MEILLEKNTVAVSFNTFLRCMFAKLQHTESFFLTAGVHMPTLNHFMAPISFSECQVYKPAVFNLVDDKILHHQLKTFLGGMEGKKYKCLMNT